MTARRSALSFLCFATPHRALPRIAGLTVCALLWQAQAAAAADDPPTEFSKAVTALTGDWVAEDWRKGTLTLHPDRFNWQSDIYLKLLAEEPAGGRSALDVARGHFDGDSLGDDTTDPTLIKMDGAKELAPGILGVQYRWAHAFDDNISFYGVISTVAGTFVPFQATCQKEDPKNPRDYPLEKCLRGMITVLIAARGETGKSTALLRLPDPPAPLNIAGWDAQFLKDGRLLATTGSFNGLRKAYLHISPPLDVPADKLAQVMKAFSDSIVDDDDEADKNPGDIRDVGTKDDPWLRRVFPEAYSGPSFQLTGTQKTADGKVRLIGLRCPNAGWQKTCVYGVDQARTQIRTGQLEDRRERYIAARQAPLPGNGIATDAVEGIYGAPAFDGSSYVINGYLFLKDGTAYRDLEKAPALIEAAQSRRSEPKNWGLWRRDGETIAVTWGDGETDTVPAAPDNLMVGGLATTTLEGRYATASSRGNALTGSSYVSRASYTFHADGTFENDRSSSFAVSGYSGTSAFPTLIASGGSSASTGRARYVIDGFLITFHYPNGEIEREAFAVYAKERDDVKRTTVLIGGTPYTLAVGK